MEHGEKKRKITRNHDREREKKHRTELLNDKGHSKVIYGPFNVTFIHSFKKKKEKKRKKNSIQIVVFDQ